MKFCRYKLDEAGEAIDGILHGDTVSPIATEGGHISISDVIFFLKKVNK